MIDHKMKLLIVGIAVCIFLIALKFTVFTSSVGSELIPGVTTSDYLITVESNSSLGEYILSDDFSLDVSGININQNSEIYVTNETDGNTLYYECYNAFIANSYSCEHEDVLEKEGRYTGIFRNDTRKIIFHIFDNEDVFEYTNYYLVLIVYKGKL